jgi:MoaA/NifB/PqqE/SkfB family radical SAM enzyme/SAM-dependent methyltransferase
MTTSDHRQHRKRRRKLPFGIYINLFRLIRNYPPLKPFLQAGYRAGIFRLARPAMVMLAVTYRCQCACRHCGVLSSRLDEGEELTTEELRGVIDSLAEMRVSMVNFFGGEPLLREDLVDLVAYAHGRGLDTRVDTNGLLLTDDVVRRLKSAGLDEIYISLDSSEAEEHDGNRGVQGCHEKAIEAIRRSRVAGLHTVISTCISRESLFGGRVEKIIDLARREGAKVRLMQPVRTGRILESEDAAMSAQDEEKVRSLLERDFVFWESEATDSPDGKFLCHSRVRLYAYISCYGDVQPCCYVPLSFGNVRKAPLREIVREMWNRPIFGGDGSTCFTNTQEFRDRYMETLRTSPGLPAAAPDQADTGWTVEEGSREWDEWAPYFEKEVDPILDDNDEAICAQVPQGTASLLDVGCGTGRLTAKLAAKAAHVTALDASVGMIEAARARLGDHGNVKLEKGSLFDSVLSDRTFDAIVLSETFHHLPRHGALEKLKSLLAPGGVLLILEGLRVRKKDLNGYARDLIRRKGLLRALGVMARMTFSPRLREHLKKEKLLTWNEFSRYFPLWLPGARTERVNRVFALVSWVKPQDCAPSGEE